MQAITELMKENGHPQIIQEDRKTTNFDLDIEVFSEDGSQLQFSQSDPRSIDQIVNLLDTPLLFTQPFLTLASERSVSTIPFRTIDLILVRTPTSPPLSPPPGWLDIAEVSAEAFYSEVVVNRTNESDRKDLARETQAAIFHAVIHTTGNRMIVLRLRTAVTAATEDQRQRFAHFFDLPILPFRLETGGVGFINPAKISHVTLYPAVKGITKPVLPAILRRCTRP